LDSLNSRLDGSELIISGLFGGRLSGLHRSRQSSELVGQGLFGGPIILGLLSRHSS